MRIAGLRYRPFPAFALRHASEGEIEQATDYHRLTPKSIFCHGCVLWVGLAVRTHCTGALAGFDPFFQRAASPKMLFCGLRHFKHRTVHVTHCRRFEFRTASEYHSVLAFFIELLKSLHLRVIIHDCSRSFPPPTLRGRWFASRKSELDQATDSFGARAVTFARCPGVNLVNQLLRQTGADEGTNWRASRSRSPSPSYCVYRN